ncbi:astacin-like [Drosophila sulfurigaster albostrigata]|uniref:astacin-like n=1 Tax=Drosophila sulfurigaster albostrigata TaxID=89887 RepID=UPI002D21BEA5|nr:astacin-like [Drosophila sulfurigaster albostrigata]
MYRISVLFVLLGLSFTYASPLYTPVMILDLSVYGKALFGQPKLAEPYVIRPQPRDAPADEDEHPEESGDYLEGDIFVPESSISMRSSPPRVSTTWPNGVVPYEISATFPQDDVDKIMRAMELIQNKSCILFIPHTTEIDYISITSLYKGCWSAVGRMGGKQEVNLQLPACTKKFGTPVHELLHVLGFPHEQNRNVRDDFVVIVNQNIKAEFMKNFKIDEHGQDFGVLYDYGSVMHYSQKAFSINGDPTIVAIQKREPGVEMGQRINISDSDVARLNRMYCETETVSTIIPVVT